MPIPVVDPMLPTLHRVNRVRTETHDTFTLEISPNGKSGFGFAPGQFNMLYVFGVGEVPISISGDPTHPETLLHTTRAVGTVTKAMKKMKAGDMIGVRGPFGAGWPIESAKGRDVVIVAGGIGLAPLRSSMYQLLARREEFGKIVLLYGTRTPDDILFRKELEKWRARLDLEVYITVDRAAGSWKGNVGVVPTLIHKAPFDPMHTIAMICGPEVMMRFTGIELQKRGLNPEQIYLSMERNMKCGIGLCGHCQYGPTFICKDGPVYRYDAIASLLSKREI